MKIDCSLTENYLKELGRARKDSWTSMKLINMCTLNDGSEPKEAIRMLQLWSNDHPQKTYLEDLLEKYPNTKVNGFGRPDNICPDDLGYNGIEDPEKCQALTCQKCWNQIMEETK